MPAARKRQRRDSHSPYEAGSQTAAQNGGAEYDSDRYENVNDVEADAPSASHLVSFLTSYADRDRGSSASGSDEEIGYGDGASEGEDDYEDLGDEDGDGDGDDSRTTPSRRGLVGGTPSSARGRRKMGSAPTTPRKGKGKGRATPLGASTPGTPKLAAGGQEEGFLRLSSADGYFLAASRAARTSGRSYATLARPLSQVEYEAGANGARANSSSSVSEAMDRASRHFPQWLAELQDGFNLLLYGYGSKRRVVNRFVCESLSKRGHCVVVNGHFPQMGIRNVLANIEDALGVGLSSDEVGAPTGNWTPLERSTHRVYTHFSTPGKAPPLFLILHNIDAPALRTPRALAALALLASAPRIHIVATFDHVNTPLLFSSSLSNAPPHAPHELLNPADIPPSRGFNWIYHAVTTFDDYDIELTYQRLSASSTTLAGLASGTIVSEEGALQILRSVPPMALRLLKLILTRQLAALPPDTASHSAHPPTAIAPVFASDVDLLQQLARDKFIAREEERFNALVGEFRDHGLVVQAELDAEGRTGRWAWVPLGKAAVERILDEMKEVQV